MEPRQACRWAEDLEQQAFELRGDALNVSKLDAPRSVTHDLRQAALRLDEARAILVQLGERREERA